MDNRRSHLKFIAQGTASILALSLSAGAAIGQEASSDGDADTRKLETITVTAQRKEETLQDAAIAIDAQSGDQLTEGGIVTGADLERAFPSLKVANGGGAISSIFLRGVGTVTTAAWLDPAIAQNYDGIYMGRPSAIVGQVFYDMDRIEVLKGPQGTLYGRNATGGVINYLPKRPELGENGGYIEADIGNFQKLALQGAGNFAIGENSAFRIAGNTINRDGYSDDGSNDAEATSIRAQFLTEPTENLSMRFSVDYTDIGGVGANGTYVGNFGFGADGPFTFFPSNLDIDSGPLTDESNAFRSGILAAPGFGFLSPAQDNFYQDNQYVGYHAEINYETDNGVLTILPAFREADAEYVFVGPGFNSGFVQEETEQSTLEVRYATEFDGPFNGIVGAFYFDETTEGNNTFNQEFVVPFQDFTQDTTSWAVFGQGTLELSEDIRVSVGLRYTEDEKDLSGNSNTLITFCGGPGPSIITPPASFGAGCAAPGGLPRFETVDTLDQLIASLIAGGFVAPGTVGATSGAPQVIPLTGTAPGAILNIPGTPSNSISDDEVTYRAGIEWDAGEDSLLFATYERGYRAGGLQLNTAFPSYEPEFIDAFTIGSKNRFAGDTVQLNLEAFYWEYEDQQLSYFTVNPNGAFDFVTTNAGKSTIAGFDVDFVWAATDATTINAKAQYLDATYDELTLSTAPPRDNFGCSGGGVPTGQLLPDGSPVLNFDCSGERALYAPEWAFDVGVAHVFDLNGFDLIGRIDSSYKGEQEGGFEYLPQTVIDSYVLTDLNLTLVPDSEAWSITAYVLNAGDERYRISPQIGPGNTFTSSFNAPTTYGVRLRANF